MVDKKIVMGKGSELCHVGWCARTESQLKQKVPVFLNEQFEHSYLLLLYGMTVGHAA